MSDFSETLPMDVLGAAQSEGAPAIMYISSDEDERMDSIDGDSVDDFYVSSEEETLDIEFMARCIERQLTQPIAIPNAETQVLKLGVGRQSQICRPSLHLHNSFSTWVWTLGLWDGMAACSFLVGAFSLKEKSPTITVGSFFFFFSLQSHSEWSTFYNLFISSVVHLRLNF